MNITNRNWCISGVKLGVLLYIGLYSCISFGGYVPKEFEHFYQFKEKKVLFLLPNDYSSKVNVIANFNTIKTIIDNEKLRNAMLEADISKSSLDKVISCITNSGDCEGIDYFYDSQKEDVSVKVSAKLMSTKKQKYSFSHVEPSESAWISTNRLYLGKYDSSLNGAVSSDNLIGLGKGHFSINGSFSPSSSRLERAGYVYDFSGYGLDVSYNLEPLTISNSTSQFDFSSPYEQYGVSLFTSDNLLNKSVDDYGRIYFDMQQSGTVEIWRNGENIYSNSYSSGQHSISYRELPEGNYFVKVIVKAGRLAPKEYLHKVNNTRRKTSVRGYDYNVGFYSALSKDKQQNKNEVKYFSLSGTKALFDNELMLSIGSNIDNDNYHAEIGGKYVNNDLDMFISYNYLRDGEFINSGISYGGFSFETERLYLDKSDLSKLTEVLYQDGEYHQLSLSYSMNVMGGYFSVYGIRYVAEADFYEDLIGTDTMSINYSRFIFNNINLNVGYEVNKGTGDNSVVNNRVYMELNIPLNDDISYGYRQDYSPNRKFSYANTLSYDIQKDADLNTNLSINQTIDKDLSDVYLGLSTDIKNEKYSANGYVNFSNSGYSNGSLSLDTTAIFTKDEAYLTDKSFDSYLIAKNNIYNINDDTSDLGIISVKENGLMNRIQTLKNDYTIVGLNNYNAYQFSFDTAISHYKSKNQSSVSEFMYSYPGSVKKVDNHLHKVVSFLTYFEDFNNNPLNDIECIGDGCLSTSRVGDGVFNISVMEDVDFKITSNEQVCIIDKPKNMNGLSRCFPSISEDINGMQLVNSGLGGEEDIIYYLGTIEEDIPSSLTMDLLNNGVKTMEFKFNGNKHLFVKIDGQDVDSSISIANKILSLDKIKTYASYQKLDNQYTKVNE